MSVRFRFDWVDAGPSPVMLARTTMASLSIKAGGSTVTSVLDRGHRIYSDEIIVPLFHVAEWLVTNWWHLWHEVRDTGEQRPGFDARHNLAFAGGGFVLPNLTMTPTAGRMHLQWTRYKPRHARIDSSTRDRKASSARRWKQNSGTVSTPCSSGFTAVPGPTLPRATSAAPGTRSTTSTPTNWSSAARLRCSAWIPSTYATRLRTGS